MDCPACKYPETRVIESRPSDEFTRRRRQCMRCGARVTTQERIQEPEAKRKASQ